jgi:hypothetical protein
MNIIIPLSNSKPRHNDLELKFCLRSIPEHDRIFIIGRDPKLPNVIHIPFEDKPGIENKSQNIYNKIMYAFTFLNEFYFHSDDHFILNGFNYEHYYDGKLEDKLVPSTSESYKVTIQNTINYLKERNLPTKFFNVHCPVHYEKSKFPILENYPPHGYCIKSLYCNVNKIQGVYYPDLKIKSFMGEQRLRQLLWSRKFFSSQDEYVNRTFFSVLASLYPLASQYEQPSPVQI